MPVDTDKRQIRGNLQIGVVGQGDDPIHFVLPYHVQTPLFRLPVVVGDRDNGPVIPAGQLSDHGIGQVSKEGISESRPDESDRIGSVNLEAAGITVDTVAQFVGSGQHFFLVFIPDRKIIVHFGDGAKGHSGFSGHI